MLHLAGGQHKSTATFGSLNTFSRAQDRKSHHDYWVGVKNTRKRNHVGDQRFCQFAKGRSEVADRLQSHTVAQACETPLIRGGASHCYDGLFHHHPGALWLCPGSPGGLQAPLLSGPVLAGPQATSPVHYSR